MGAGNEARGRPEKVAWLLSSTFYYIMTHHYCREGGRGEGEENVSVYVMHTVTLNTVDIPLWVDCPLLPAARHSVYV